MADETPPAPQGEERTLQVRLHRKGPVLKPIEPREHEEMSHLILSLLMDGDGCLGYAHLMRAMNWERMVEGQGITVIKPDHDGLFHCGFNFDLLRRLSLPAQKEVLKKQALKIPFGHVSDRMRKLIDQYGKQIATLAGDLALNQYINTGLLGEEGINLPSPELFDLEGGQTTEWYAEQLQEQGLPGEGEITVRNRIAFGDPSASAEAQDEMMDLLEGMTDSMGFTRMDSTEFGDVSEVTLKLLNEQTINGVESLMNSLDKSLKSQGFWGADCEEFIQSLKRRVELPWYHIILQKEGQHRSPVVEMTRLKPSRRGSHYWGRRRRYECRVLFYVDTSGSMGGNELQHVESILQAMSLRGTEVYVGQSDARSAEELQDKPPVLFRPHDSLEKFTGRGGTDFRGAFEYADKYMFPRPDFIVYFTDGYGTAPAEPAFDTIWVLTSTGYSPDQFRDAVCSWGHVVVFNTEDVGVSAP